MANLFKAAAILGLVVLSACTNPNRFGAGADGANGANGGAGGITSGSLGDPGDPNSPAYFNQSVGNMVHFLVDQHTLSPEAQMILGRQADWLSSHPGYAALIEGHADEQGTRQYNIALGDRRANAVREFLISRGVSSSRITTISYGKERPLSLCSDESCLAQNRRAVTVVTAGAGV